MANKHLSSLFKPLKIKGLALKNRIVMPAMGTRFADENGAVTQRLIDYYVERTKGGVGLIIVQHSFINEQRVACSLLLSNDQMISGLNNLVEAVHEEGGRVAIQVGNLGFVYPGGKGPDKLNPSEIKGLIKQFIFAAIRVRDAGFDAVEVHAAHRYLISQFLSPQTNHRNDEYGGDMERRMNFLIEIVQGIREKVGTDYPLMVRINGDGFDPEGLGLEEAKVVAKRLEAVGVDVIDVSAGSWKSEERTVPPRRFARGCHVYLAAGIKQEVSIPVITAGRINDPVLADKIIQEGSADLVGMGRALLADPFLPEKARRGDFENIRMCIGCNYCRHDRLDKNKKLRCAINAALGREREYALKEARERKRIFVIGGGPAGMEAAWTLKERGHEVVLWEKEVELGGQLRYAVIPPYKDELKNILQWLSYKLRKAGVEIHLGHEVTGGFLSGAGVDEIIFATGSKQVIPDEFKASGQQVFTAREVLGGRDLALGTHVVIIGGGRVGCETAEYVAEKGKKVAIVEILDKIGLDIEPRARKLLLERLISLGVDFYCKSEVVKIQNREVIFHDKDGLEKKLFAESVILAMGSQPNNRMEQEMLSQGKAVYTIGDCQEPEDLAHAIHAGAHIGRQI